jgi:Zn finger protein HypA/HybF involved in hydrogenase expression
VKKYDYIVTPRKNDPLNECLDCKYEGREWGELDQGLDEEAEVVCPNCGSLHYYIKGEEECDK